MGFLCVVLFSVWSSAVWFKWANEFVLYRKKGWRVFLWNVLEYSISSRIPLLDKLPCCICFNAVERRNETSLHVRHKCDPSFLIVLKSFQFISCDRCLFFLLCVETLKIRFYFIKIFFMFHFIEKNIKETFVPRTWNDAETVKKLGSHLCTPSVSSFTIHHVDKDTWLTERTRN